MSCICERPKVHADPRKAGWCATCLKRLDPRWLSSSATVAEFFDYLQRTFPGDPPDTFLAFRAQCEERERAGRDQFGLSYLLRENLPEAAEEAADLANYLLFDVLRHRRDFPGAEDEDMAIALEGARYAYKAHEAAALLRAKRRGSP